MPQTAAGDGTDCRADRQSSKRYRRCKQTCVAPVVSLYVARMASGSGSPPHTARPPSMSWFCSGTAWSGGLCARTSSSTMDKSCAGHAHTYVDWRTSRLVRTQAHGCKYPHARHEVVCFHPSVGPKQCSCEGGLQTPACGVAKSATVQQEVEANRRQQPSTVRNPTWTGGYL